MLYGFEISRIVLNKSVFKWHQCVSLYCQLSLGEGMAFELNANKLIINPFYSRIISVWLKLMVKVVDRTSIYVGSRRTSNSAACPGVAYSDICLCLVLQNP